MPNEDMLRAQLRERDIKLQKHQRTIRDQIDTIAALKRQIAALGKVIEGMGKNLDAKNGMVE